jgi:hypothetical protein
MIPNYLSAEADQPVIVVGLKWCRRVLAWRKRCAKIGE